MGIEAIQQIVTKYWPIVLGAVAFATAVFTAVGSGQSLRKNRLESRKLQLEVSEKERQTAEKR
jgi:hypothetical protein